MPHLALKDVTRKPCILAGPFINQIDHSIPLASILKIPLITNDPAIFFSYKNYYPNFSCYLKNFHFPSLMKQFHTFIYGFNIQSENCPSASFKELQNLLIKQDPKNTFLKKHLKSIYHLHGCSDKRWFCDHKHLLDVDKILMYGKHNSDLFQSLGLLQKIKSYEYVGNYRKAHYIKHQNFFDTITEKYVFSKFEKKQPTIFYAPTWNDKTNASSISKALMPILKNLPSRFNLLIKLHPFSNELQKTLQRYSSRPNIVILHQFPLIYPLLKKVSAYLGDYSSIGYDALSFNLPMFFLNHDNRAVNDPTTLLFQTGITFFADDLLNVYSVIEKEMRRKNNAFIEKQNKLYKYAFGKDLPYSQTERKLKKLILG